MNKTKPLIGKGRLPDFTEDYMKIQNQEGLRVVASSLFPSGITNIESNTEFTEVYEWIIYYEEKYVAKKQQPKVEEEIKLVM